MKRNYHDCVLEWKKLLLGGLADDQWELDWTTLGSLKASGQSVKAQVVAKGDGIWAADGLAEAAEAVAQEMGHALRVRSTVSNGARLKAGKVVAEWDGSARAILALERPYLNLASYAGGVATRTQRFVDLVTKACPKNTPRVTLTRKTLPGYRDVAVRAVVAGGGYPHRVSLAGGVLIKENHIAAAGGIRAAIEGVREVAPHLLKIEVEVRNAHELKQAVAAKADGVLLDNFTPVQVKDAIAWIATQLDQPFVEVSGGLSEDTIARYAIPGVSVLSVGGITHSVQAIDLSLLVK